MGLFEFVGAFVGGALFLVGISAIIGLQGKNIIFSILMMCLLLFLLIFDGRGVDRSVQIKHLEEEINTLKKEDIYRLNELVYWLTQDHTHRASDDRPTGSKVPLKKKYKPRWSKP